MKMLKTYWRKLEKCLNEWFRYRSGALLVQAYVESQLPGEGPSAFELI